MLAISTAGIDTLSTHGIQHLRHPAPQQLDPKPPLRSASDEPLNVLEAFFRNGIRRVGDYPDIRNTWTC
jgi:hypothetical protein